VPLYTKRRRRRPEINIIPLVDVLIVVIFFFLMTMQFRSLQSLDITLPKVDTAGAVKPAQHFIVGVDKSGKYYIDNKVVTPDELTAALTDAAKTQGTAVNVLIFADQDTPLKEVTFVMDQSRKLNLDNVRLQTR
jgi:biopolymer transport protein ExbD